MESFMHFFKGFGIHPSEINVHIFNKNDVSYVIFEDIGKGTSVTNASEQLATEIVSLRKLDHNKCRFFEYYPKDNSFDEITYSWINNEAFKAQWKPGDQEILCLLKQ